MSVLSTGQNANVPTSTIAAARPSRPAQHPFLAACVVLLYWVAPVQAQNAFKWEAFEERVESARNIVALDNTAFGENIGLQTGRLGFTVTDVDIPGNNALPVRFTRSYELVKRRDIVPDRMLADWEVETPRISGRFATEWLAGSSTNRCSDTTPPTVPPSVSHVFNHGDFWQGMRLNIPGVVETELLTPTPGISKPTDGHTYLWTSSDGQTHLYCLSSLVGGGTGEGFVAVTADGTRYYFNRMAQRPVRGLMERQYVGTTPVTYTQSVKENILYATRVEDRFGNYVDYTYTNTPTQPGKLTKIESSDGRRIDVEYDTSGKIWRVKAGSTSSPAQRTWGYAYGVDSSPAARLTLTGVTLPDGSGWNIQFAQFGYSAIYYGQPSADPYETFRTCTMLPDPRNGELPVTSPAPVTLVGKITHPAGAKMTYSLDIREFFRSEVTVVCNNFNLTSGGAIGNQSDDVPLYPLNWHDWSLSSKTLEGPGMSPQTWIYTYDADKPSYWYRGPYHFAYGNLPTCPTGVNCSLPMCTSPICADRAYTTVQAPDSSLERYSYGNTWQYDEGKLLKVQRGYNSTTKTALETIDHTYDLSQSADQAYPKRFGASPRSRVDGFTSEFHRPAFSKVTTQSGATFTWSVDMDAGLCGSGFKCLDTLARPRKVNKASSLGYSKTETYAYADHLTKWVMGQLSSTQVNGETLASAAYHPTYAVMTQFSAFGQLQQTLAYDTVSSIASGLLGTVSSATDANSKITTLSNWYRGIPRTINHPTGFSQSAEVNDFGWIKSTIDELGNKRCYGHDTMGRVNLVTHPSESVMGVCNTTSWASTAITYAKVASVEYGIPSQHWRRTEVTGTHQHETFYDGLWRPILTRQSASDSSISSSSIRRSFDHEGRESFASYPSAALANIGINYTTLNTGAWTYYDALGRVTQRSQNSELGLLTSSTAYLTGLSTQSTNARGFQTTTYYQAFDEPTRDYPTSLSEPGGVTTTINRDAFHNPTSINRAGFWNSTYLTATRHFVYDAQRRLCKRVDPESGATVMDYDAAGNLLWSVRSSSLTNTTDCQRTFVLSSARSWRTYDNRNRLTAVDHPIGTPDESYSYYANGALFTASTTDGGTWTYQYNKRGLPTAETLSIDSKTFAIGYAYNTLGHANTLTYPSGLSVSLNPNALGQPRQAGSYASTATYHPDGSLAGFNYGNGIVHSRTLNTRGLSQRIRDSYGSVSRFDHTFAYDPNGNVTQLTDGVDYSENRFMAYDGRDRLIQADAPYIYGDEIYDYDPLDNLRRAAVYPLGGGSYLLDYRFVYHANQRLDRIDDPIGALLWDFSHNALGETLTRTGAGSSWNYLWSAAGRMTQGGNESYVYDAHGHRTRATRSGTGSTRYQIHSRGGKLLYVEDSRDNQRIDYLHLGGKLIAQRSRPLYTTTATTTYHHTDHLGSASVETNPSGTQTQRTLRAPYGSPYDGVYREGPGFAGHVTDTATNLTYMQQRYYDPVAMRFISPDPVDVSTTNGGNFNRYWYANNNPYRFTDPDGLLACMGNNMDCFEQREKMGQRGTPSFQSKEGGGCSECDEIKETRTQILTDGAEKIQEAGVYASKEAAWMAGGAIIGKVLGAFSGAIIFGRNIPDKATNVLSHIKKYGAPPSGYVGGRVFKNREGHLPSGGAYREYDVDPSPAPGIRRNAERIVLDETSGRAWYTNDHYKTFTEIK